MNESNYTSNHTFYYLVVVVDRNQNRLEFLKWSDLPQQTYIKFFWYFKYRSALLQIKYPKCEIRCNWGVYTEPSKKSQTIILQNKIISRKRKVTEMKNRLLKLTSQWNELFPYQEDPLYIKFMERMNKAEDELSDFTKELELL